MPQRITRPYVVFEGRNYTLQDSGYYTHGNYRNKGGQRLLHREVWAKANGRPAPDGYDVHHKDHNKDNNDPSNLELLSASEHARHHGPYRGGCVDWDPETRGRIRSAAWKRRQPRSLVCECCQTPFESTGMRAKFCSPYCTGKHRSCRRLGLCASGRVL